jgi:hypothetical protein
MTELPYIMYLTRVGAHELDFPTPPLSPAQLARVGRATARVRKLLRGQVVQERSESLTDDEIRTVAANVRDDVAAWRLRNPVPLLRRHTVAEQVWQEVVAHRARALQAHSIGGSTEVKPTDAVIVISQ